jgi:hypothetical protein
MGESVFTRDRHAIVAAGVDGRDISGEDRGHAGDIKGVGKGVSMSQLPALRERTIASPGRMIRIAAMLPRPRPPPFPPPHAREDGEGADGDSGCGFGQRLRSLRPELGDRVEQAAAVADRRNAQLPQIFRRQPAQDLPVDIVGAEREQILVRPETAQPFRNVHCNSRGRMSPRSITAPPTPSVQDGREKRAASCAVAKGPPIA